LLITVALLLSACASDPLLRSQGNFQTGIYATGISQNNAQAGVWNSGFMLKIDSATATYGLLFSGSVSRGNARLEILDEDSRVVWQSEPQSGSFQVTHLLEGVPAGTYQPTIRWDGPITATFDLYTVPGEAVQIPVVKPIALLGGLGMILVSLGFLAFVWQKRLPFKPLALGALLWIITVAVKFFIAIPLNSTIIRFLGPVGDGRWQDWVFGLYIGLLTGITEVLMVWWFLRKKPPENEGKAKKRLSLRIKRREWSQALAFGIGFGVVEALLLGLSSFSSVIAGLTVPEQIPATTLTALAVANHPLVALAPVWERFFTVFIHITCNLLLFLGAVSGKNRYFWYSFIFKSGLDTVAGLAQLFGIDTLAFMWLIEGIVGLFGLVGIWGMRWIQNHYPTIPPAEPSEQQPLPEPGAESSAT
jgi:hypothetical protein